jgi:hypothetical protein
MKLDVIGHGGSENVYLDLLNPRDGSYYRATIYVNWYGPHEVYLPTSVFQYVAPALNSAPPTWGGTVDIRLSTDNQQDVAPYVDISRVTVEGPKASG